ncbi:MAG: S1/P1 Nuclease [Candidatus Amoebophilus sp. 36-38]|nr:MAG: S1/P1 Nuclease [Candidatus Amoebophilus sp. 36-38]
MKIKFIWMYLLLVSFSVNALAWGFEAHRYINRCAVFTLPPSMFTFYKYYLGYLTENAVNPDKKRYLIEGEAAHHYIDLEYYGDNPFNKLPQNWNQAIQQYAADTLLENGILPWHIYLMKHRLTAAFRNKDIQQILKLSADIGHYIADANVPLHTTQNYNGQLTNQHGIHGLWETRLPELFKETYNIFIGQATYVEDPQKAAWDAIMQAHAAVKDVLRLEKNLSQSFNKLNKFSFEKKGKSLRKVYSEAYATVYHELLAGQVERQMRASIKMVGDFWLTCWIDAGEPDLNELLGVNLAEESKEEPFNQLQLQVRECGD